MKLSDRLDRIYTPIPYLREVIRRFTKKKLNRLKIDKPHSLTHHLNVAFFTDTYLPNIDGVVSSILTFRKELVNRGDTVYIFTSGTRNDKRQNKDKEVFFYTSVRFPPYPQYKIALFPFSAQKTVKKKKIDLIHSHALTAMGVASIATAMESGLPLVGTFHTLVPKADRFIVNSKIMRNLYSRITWSAIKEFYKPFDLVTAPTRSTEKLLNEQGITNTSIVPNGINLNRFSQKNDGKIIKEMLNIPDSSKVVLTSGRLSFEKNVDVIINAAKKIMKEEDVKFIIQGEGPAKKKYEALTRKLGIQDKFYFTGFVKEFEVPYFYAVTDVFISASTFETQGLALLEAMASGAVCVGANSMAIPELISDKRNGFLFDPFNVTDCASVLSTALNLSVKKKKSLQRQGLKTAKEYSIEKSTDKLLIAYSMVL